MSGNASKYLSHYKRPNGVKHNEDGSVLCTSAQLINSEVMPGATHLSAVWYLNPGVHNTPTHTHDVDEIVGFVGSDPDDVDNLNGVVRFFIDGEWAEIDKSCFIFIPAGVEHCPYEIVRVDRPILHISMLPVEKYERDAGALENGE